MMTIERASRFAAVCAAVWGASTAAHACPKGAIAHRGACLSRTDYALELGRTCATLPVDRDRAATTEDPARRACDELSGMVPDVESTWERQCASNDAAACVLFGGAAQGYRTASARVELWVARCKGGECNGHRATVERLGFVGTKRDESVSRAAFAKACQGGQLAACLEATKTTPDASSLRDACLARGDVRTCSEAAYQVAVVGRVTDAVLMAKVERTLTAGCDAGQGSACQNLGFLAERKLVGVKPAVAVRDLYQRACDAHHPLGCASLVMFALRTPSLSKSIAWANVVPSLEAACDEAAEPAREACLGLGHALARSLGVKGQVARGQALVGRLCKAGFTDACVR